jgi:transcriptional regulator with XRE-family HTH domain
MKLDPERIRELRDEHGLSQETLAEAAGLSARTIQRVESSGLASGETAMALAAVFQTQVDRLEDPEVDRAQLIRRVERGHRLATVSVLTGAALAALGVTADAAYGGLPIGSAGLLIGGIGLVAGLGCAVLSRLAAGSRSNFTMQVRRSPMEKPE